MSVSTVSYLSDTGQRDPEDLLKWLVFACLVLVFFGLMNWVIL